MTVKVHVNQHIIRANKTKNENNPPITIIRGSKRERHFEVELLGKSKIVYSPDKPLSCGARVYIIAENAVGI